MSPHKVFVDGPRGSIDLSIQGREHISQLRYKLLHHPPLPEAMQITVVGTFMPCALLSCGWWEENRQNLGADFRWKNRIQEWFFKGFDLWAPSWDYTWNFDEWNPSGEQQHFIAQLGSGDEADSLPVFVPRSRAAIIQDEYLQGRRCLEVEVTGFLGHRRQFCRACHNAQDVCEVCKRLSLFGGLLDYCLWIDENNSDHDVMPLAVQPQIYSGYLWKCVAPKQWISNSTSINLSHLFFLWVHTNFADEDTIKYNLDLLNYNESKIRAEFGELVLFQKSSALVPGKPAWDPKDICKLLRGGTVKVS
ncbi:MAG: hypothetical protein AB1847_09675 [bacterium]